MKHDTIKLDSIIRRVIRESARKYSKPIVEQTEQGGLTFIDPNVNPVVDPIDTSDDSNKGTNKIKKDQEGRLPGAKWYGFDPKTKKFILGPNKGKTAKQVFGTNDVSPKPNPQVTPTDDPKYVPKARAKRMYDCKGLVRDSEDLYRNLIVGTKPQRIAGGGLAGGIPAIANEKEWNAVETALKSLTGNRGIVIYGSTFIDKNSSNIWKPIFEWIGKNLGGDRLKEELTYIEFDKINTYKKIADRYKTIKPMDPDNPKPEDTRRRNDANAWKGSNIQSGMPAWANMLILLLISTGIIGAVGWRILKKRGFPAISKFWGKRIRPITEEEILQLREYIEKEYKAKNITEEDMVIWRQFFRQKKWLGFANKRKELADIMRRVELGPKMPAGWAPRRWDGISMETYIRLYLDDILANEASFTNQLLKYEKDVLVPMREAEYGIKGDVIPNKKTTPKPKTTTTSSSNKLTKLKLKPTATETQSKLFTTIKIQNPEIISSKELKQIFAELQYKDVENIMKNKGESAQAWSTIKSEYKAGNVALINTHINRGRVPAYAIWLQDMKQAFPKKDVSTFDKVAYNRYKVYMKLYNLMKA